MGQYIVKLKEHYLIWSSIVDAPITYGMDMAQLEQWIQSRYGSEGMRELPERLARVDAKGTSAMDDDSAEDTIWLNRAGPGESVLTIEGIYRHFCLGEPVQDGWVAAVPINERDEADDDGDGLYERVVGNWPNVA